MKKVVIFGLLGVLSLGVLGIARAAARQAGSWRAQHAGFFIRHLERELDVTDAQRESIKAILQKESPTIQSIAAELEQQNAQLRSKPAYDEAFVRSVAQQRNATLTNALVEREKIRYEVFATLDPEQRQKLQHLCDDFRSAIQDRLANLGDQL
jgi:Spy/CpxP family protein refolding chaperone